ncbi:MAG: hypothetical protein ACLFQA_02240 [Bacteroidales bacterium]
MNSFLHTRCLKRPLSCFYGNDGRLIMLAFFSISLLMSCNPEEWEVVDCSECYTRKPEEAEINVKLTLNNTNPYVVVNVYSGRIEEEILILSDTARTETWNTVLPVDEYYTVTATYWSGAADLTYYNVTAIDGSHIRTRKISDTCDEPCWVVRGNDFNVRLKY